MTTRSFKVLALLAGLSLLVACGSDSDGNGTPANEAGTTSDGGGVTIPDGGGVTFDTGDPDPDTGGVTPTPDTGTTTPDKSCAEVLQCAQGCGSDQNCANACIAQGDADAQTKLAALNSCLQGALTGACKDSCTDQTSTECQNCVQGECSDQLTACLGGGGPAQAGFGDVCDLAAPQCPAGLECVGVQGGTDGKGFCTKKCTNQGGLCEGAPDGTMSACILGTQGGTDNYCAFLCAAGGQNHQCPSTMTCGTEQPPGSGQKPCQP